MDLLNCEKSNLEDNVLEVVSDMVSYMVELVSQVQPFGEPTSDMIIGKSALLAPSKDDDEDTLIVKDLVDYMVELVSAAVPFKPFDGSAPSISDISMIDLDSQLDNLMENEARRCQTCKKTGAQQQMLVNCKVHFVCSLACYLQTRPDDDCFRCHRQLPEGKGFLSTFNCATLCSETCLDGHEGDNEPVTKCFNCKSQLVKDKLFYWQMMEFCSEDCVQETQLNFGSECASCSKAVDRQSLGKYSVRFGDIIKQFCNGTCLENYKKSLKVCAFCQKNLKYCKTICVSTVGSGDKMKLREFCDQICLSNFEAMLSLKTSVQVLCNECEKFVEGKRVIDIKVNNQNYCFCSNICVASFKHRLKILDVFCDNCHTYSWSLSQLELLHFSGITKLFCCSKCLSMYMLKNRRIVSCMCCKVKKYNFDMIEQFNWPNMQSKLFCSLNCLSLTNFTLEHHRKYHFPTRKIECDQCHRMEMPQFYLEADSDIHSQISAPVLKCFCSYTCVSQFQRQWMPDTLKPKLPKRKSDCQRFEESEQPNGSEANTSAMWTPALRMASQVRQNQISGVTKIGLNTSSTSTVQTNSYSTSSSDIQPVQQVIKELVKEVREVIVKVPENKIIKNKATYFRPSTVTKAISCRPLVSDAETQTDVDLKMILPMMLPIPVFIPVPVAYMQPLAFPFPFPVPIVCPVQREKSTEISAENSPENVEMEEEVKSSKIQQNNNRLSVDSDLSFGGNPMANLLSLSSDLPDELLDNNSNNVGDLISSYFNDNNSDDSNHQVFKRREESDPDFVPKRGRGRPSGSRGTTPRGRGSGRGRGRPRTKR